MIRLFELRAQRTLLEKLHQIFEELAPQPSFSVRLTAFYSLNLSIKMDSG